MDIALAKKFTFHSLVKFAMPNMLVKVGIWTAVSIAEVLGFIVAVFYILKKRINIITFQISEVIVLRKRINLSMLFVVLFCIAVFVYTRYVEPNLLSMHSIDIQTNQPIKPCTVIYFTDTHFGKYYDTSHIEKIVKKINKESPDIVIFGGDLLDNYARDRESIDLEYLKSELAKIKTRIGKYAVWGNHDYGGGAVRIYEDFMTSSGFEILDNMSIELKEYGIKIIGYDDYLMGWTDPSLYEIKGKLFNIVISHEPIVSQFILNESENFMLSGHTHGGQVNIPFLTKKLLPKGSGEFVKGFYTTDEIGTDTSLEMYTSSGIGMTRYPFRFLNIPEIIKINFQQTTKE